MAVKRPDIWQSTAFEAGTIVQTPNTALQRCAASIALDVAGMGPLSLHPETIVPIHIAALVDPLTKIQARMLHDAFVLA